MINVSKLIAISMAILLFQIHGSKADNKFIDILTKYNIAHSSGDCVSALNYVDDLMSIEPEYTFQLISNQYIEGICRKKNYGKALKALQSVTEEVLEMPHSLHLIWLLYEKTTIHKEKIEIISKIPDIIFRHMETGGQHSGFAEFFKFSEEYPAFYQNLLNELEYFARIENNSNLKLAKVRELIQINKYPKSTRKWLWDLKKNNNTEAHFLFAKHISNKLRDYQSNLRFAAANDLPKAQTELARSIAQNGGSYGKGEAYYWYVLALQNGEPVEKEMREFKVY